MSQNSYLKAIAQDASMLQEALARDPALLSRLDRHGQTLMHYLAEGDGTVEASLPAAVLWQSPFVNWQQINAQGLTPLHVLLSNTRRPALKAFHIAQGCNSSFDVNSLTRDGQDSLFDYMLERREWGVMVGLLNMGADPFLSGAKKDLSDWLNAQKAILKEAMVIDHAALQQYADFNGYLSRIFKTACATLVAPENAYLHRQRLITMSVKLQHHQGAWQTHAALCQERQAALQCLRELLTRLNPSPPLTQVNLLMVGSRPNAFNANPTPFDAKTWEISNVEGFKV